MTDYILGKSKIDKKSFIASTVVSTPMMSKIALTNNIKIELSLTGFKWIGKMINDFKDLKFLAGGEESFGYLVGDFVRDKDALTSSLLVSEICSELKANGSNFYERMIDCYIKYGFFKEKLFTLKKEGKKGAQEIKNILSNLKSNPPEKLLDDKTLFIEDYESSIKTNVDTGEQSMINLPKTNMIIFKSQKGFKVAVRPSGTEPKIKYYFSVNCSLNNKSEFLQKNKLLNEKLSQLLIDFTN
jgi:phosphoglucomutase